MNQFQEAVNRWAKECFGPTIAMNKAERNYRFIEESLELVQACGMTKEEVLKMVEYVFSRDKGSIGEEVGGTMITLAQLCTANNISLPQEMIRELNKVKEKRLKISHKYWTKKAGLRGGR